MFLGTCGDSTTEDTNFVKRSQWIDLDSTASVNHCVLTEGGSPNKMENGLSFDWKSRLPITQHHPPVSIYPQQLTQVALFWFTVSTFFAFPSEHWQDMIACFQICHALTNALNDPFYSLKEKKRKRYISFHCTSLKICFLLTTTKKVYEITYPPASWPRILGNRGFCPCRIEIDLGFNVLYINMNQLT